MSNLLSEAIRLRADCVESHDTDAAELLRVLARVVEGKEVLKAFGAPGDWGYGTPIGSGLYAELKKPCPDKEGGAS